MGAIVRYILKFLRRGLLLIVVMLLLQYSTLPLGVEWYAIAHIVSDYQFDYLGWEINGVSGKALQTFWGTHPYMDEITRSAYVRAYFADVAHIQQLNRQINSIFTDPDIPDPQTASADLRMQRNELRADLESRQWTAEAILEGQIATILVEQGFGTLGQLLPPMSMHFTDVPNLLVVSPRDTIRRDVQINVIPLPVDLITALENRIETEQDVSALILPLGGMALYPAMVLETSNLSWAIETFAHEWVHHYLYFFPLGLQYLNGETYIINETTADLFGKEVRQLVAARYYPELIAETAQISSSLNPAMCRDEACLVRRPRPLVTPWLVSWGGNDQTTPPFDFGAAMNETRVTVDALLAEGKVNEAETYMEERRRVFAANGYPIRRLNQAYFAFYGGYQGGSAPGAAGEDPIGPAVRVVRETSPNLHDFVVTMRTITTRDELLAQANRIAPEP